MAIQSAEEDQSTDQLVSELKDADALIQRLEMALLNNRSPEPTELPITQVSWYQAAAYLRWMGEQEGFPEEQQSYPPVDELLRINDFEPFLRTKNEQDLARQRTGYRMPTDVEWEYACRALSLTSRSMGTDIACMDDYCVSSRNSGSVLQPIASKMPNNFGLFDMLGNATEWCDNEFQQGRIEVRGGSFRDGLTEVRSAFSDGIRPWDVNRTVTFRAARTLPVDRDN